MRKYLEILGSLDIFRGIKGLELNALLNCLNAQVRRFEKDRLVLLSGQSIQSFGVVLSGQIQIYHEDYYGNKSILGHVGPGGLFAEAFVFSEKKTSPVSVQTMSESEILMIDGERLVSPCSHNCAFHTGLIRNMLQIIAQKNVALTQKIEITSRRTTREKLMAFLSSVAQESGSNRFAIPFNRQELADYLCVDRSAMCAELSKLRDDGLLDYHKNQFELLAKEEI